MQSELAITKHGYRAQFGFINTESTETQVLDGSSGAATSAALAGGHYRLASVMFADCWVKIGAAVTAVSEEGTLINGAEYFVIAPANKVSVIGGKLNITKVEKP